MDVCLRVVVLFHCYLFLCNTRSQFGLFRANVDVKEPDVSFLHSRLDSGVSWVLFLSACYLSIARCLRVCSPKSAEAEAHLLLQSRTLLEKALSTGRFEDITLVVTLDTALDLPITLMRQHILMLNALPTQSPEQKHSLDRFAAHLPRLASIKAAIDQSSVPDAHGIENQSLVACGNTGCRSREPFGGPRFKTCGACECASYCSVVCQKAHWLEHRTECLEKRQERQGWKTLVATIAEKCC